MEDTINKATFKPRFVSEFSMGSLDFERYNEWLKYIEHWSSIINSSAIPSLEMCQAYYAGLLNIYDSWRPLIAIPDITIELDNAFDRCKLMKRVWEQSLESGMQLNKNTVLNFVDLLNIIKRKLLGIKQVIGLGIVVRKNTTVMEKIRLGVRGNKDFSNLPEA